MKDLAQIPFQSIIDALLDETHPFKPVFLFRLSGLQTHELSLLKKNWAKISVQRRRDILDDMEEFTESDPLMAFEPVGYLALKDTDPQVRLTATRLLWEESSLELAHTLLHMLETDEDEEVRAGVASALGNFIYLGEIEEVPKTIFKQVENQLIHTFRSTEPPSVRRRALEALGFSTRAEIPSLIEAVYNSGDDEWTVSALFAMGRSADLRWEADVLAMLDHTNPNIRMEAARAAGELDLERALPALLELLEDSHAEVRSAAIWSLSQTGGEGVEEALESLLEDNEDEDEAGLIEDALDNLAFNQDFRPLELFDFDQDTLAGFIHEIDDLEEADEEDLEDE